MPADCTGRTEEHQVVVAALEGHSSRSLAAADQGLFRRVAKVCAAARLAGWITHDFRGTAARNLAPAGVPGS